MKSIIYIVIIFSLFATACESEFEFKADDFPPVLVLNGIVDQDSVFIINVSRSGGINETYNLGDLFVNDATVKLFDGEDYVETMTLDSLGFYHSVSTAQAGEIYSIKVEKEGYPTATAKLDFTDIPEFNIKELSHSVVYDSIWAYDLPEIGEVALQYINVVYTIELTDPASENNYYDIGLNTILRNIMRQSTWDNETGEETEIHNTYNEANVEELYTSFVNNEDYQMFESSMHSNWTTFLYGYNVRAMDDKLFSGQKIELKYETGFWTSEVNPLVFIVKSIPEELIKYFDSEDLYFNSNDNPYSEPVNVYSNVENGIGFVCGVPCSKIEFDIE